MTLSDREINAIKLLLKRLNKDRSIVNHKQIAEEVSLNKEELTIVFNKLCDIFYLEEYFAKSQGFGGNEFDLARGKYYFDFDFEEWLKSQTKEKEEETESKEQEKRIRDLTEENLKINTNFTKYQHRFRHLDTANKFVNLFLNSKILIGVLLTTSLWGFTDLIRRILLFLLQ